MTTAFQKMRRRFFYAGRQVIGILPLALAANSAAQELDHVFLKGPYLQAPGSNTMTILWETPANTPGILHYGLNGKLNRALRLESPRQLTVVSTNSITNIVSGVSTNVTKVGLTNHYYLNELTLTNLRAHSVYSYSAETDGIRTPPKKFKTFGAHPRKITFIAYGDTRSNPKLHAAVAANFKHYAPDFILHTGDLVTNGKRQDLWGKEFFGPLAQVIDEVPILPAIGNHEEDGMNYLHYLHLPGKKRWYSYDVGPVHVLSLDFHYEKETDEQFKFAKEDLSASRAPWKIVFLHYPVFNIGGHNTGWGHAAYLPIFHQTKVDMVVAGHSHIYERFRPIASKSISGTWPITYITTGGGGAPLYVSYTHPALAAWATTNHFVVFEATPTTLKGRALTTNEIVLDTFELRKNNGAYSSSYLAQVYPEETLRLAFDAAPSLTPEAASAPTTNATGKLMFTLRPMKTYKQPVALEIGLTPDSAQYYEIEGGPVHTITPSSTESNKVVWASLRTTGRKKIEKPSPGKELSPALIFQARVLANMIDTVAYGQKCKVSTNAVQALKKLAEHPQK